MKRISVSRVMMHIAILLFWVGMIYTFLYIPLFIDYVRSKKTLNILAWPTALDVQYVQDFEREMGVKINVTYFENNEELILKMRSGKKHGYDIIMPSDLSTPELIRHNLLRKLDHTKLTFWNDLYPALLNHSYDPHNTYTLPYMWSVYGLGIDTSYFKDDVQDRGWKLIFEPQEEYCVGMPDDEKEAIAIAAFYLFKREDYSSPKKIEQLIDLLKRQKRWVGMYTDIRTDYLLLSRTCPIVVTSSSDIARVMKQDDGIVFVVPQEGSFILIDSFALPIDSDQEELAYMFLNYLYQPSILKKYAHKFGFFPARQRIIDADERISFSNITQDAFDRLYFFKPLLSPDQMSYVWISLKA